MLARMRVAWLLLLCFAPLPARAEYLGAAACAGCHPAVVASWEKTAHARASRQEVLGAHEHSARCLACHATGDGLRVQGKWPGVQCEACHGPGADYLPDDVMRDPVLARALGLRDPRASCGRCHVAQLGTIPFDFSAFWARIAH
jgi:hypothetical protein